MYVSLAAGSFRRANTRSLVQFGDPQIRRFNCVAVDLRGHGYTTGDDIPAHYSGKEAGEEIAKIIVRPFLEAHSPKLTYTYRKHSNSRHVILWRSA